MNYTKLLKPLFSCIAILFCAFVTSQNTQLAPKMDRLIYCYSVDSVKNTIYVGGQLGFSGSPAHVYAQNAANGNLLTNWNPYISLGSSTAKLTAIHAHNDTVYVGGTFSEVNGQTRNAIAALDNNGNTLLWYPGNIFSPYTPINGFAADENYLYVSTDIANVYNAGIIKINKRTGHVINDSVGINQLDQPCYRIKLINDTLYATTDQGLVVCNKNDLSVLSEIIGQDNFAYNNNWSPAFDFDLKGDTLFFAGNFYTSNHKGVLAYDRKTNAMITSWDQPLLGNCGINLYLDLPTTYIEPFASTVLVYDTALFIGGVQLRNLGIHTCSNDYTVLKADPDKTNSLYEITETLKWGNLRHHARQFSAIGNLLYTISSYRVSNGSGGYYISDSLSAHCLTPRKPLPFDVFTKNVCPKTSNVSYGISKAFNVTYSWSYSGNGVTIHQQDSNTTTLSFSQNATSGVLSVKAISVCGLQSEEQIFSINVLPEPNISAGSDKQLDCVNSLVLLRGVSDTLDVKYKWDDPLGGTYNNDSVFTNIVGAHVLTVTKNTTGCYKTDTAIVTLDTVKPVPAIVTPGPYSVSCKANSLIVWGASDDPADSLRWINSNSNTYANPLIPQGADTGYYKLYITDINNGCTSDTLIFVGGNFVKPVFDSVSSSLITCYNPLSLLNGQGVDSSNTFVRWLVNGDTLLNPAQTNHIGTVTAQLIDNNTGCITLENVTITSNTAPPTVNAPSSKAFNCSTDTLTFSGSSTTPNTLSNWMGPGNFSSADPAVVTQQGVYTFIVTRTDNGCSKSDTVNVGYEPILELKSVNDDTTVCFGTSTMVSSVPVGGTAPFNYTWMQNGTVIGNSAQEIVTPDNDVVNYVVNINDNNGCVGVDTIRVNRATTLRDSIVAFQPCDGSATGQLQFFASGSVPPYMYSLNSGLYQSTQSFNNLNYGLYDISIRDSLGCEKNVQAEINTLSQLPKPNFLVSTNLMMGDTFVMVDISNPKPDMINWTFPTNSTMIDSTYLSPVIVCSDSGDFIISMKATFGGCEMIVSKTIHITPFDSTFADSNNNNGIESIILSPNPSDGNFSVNVKLYKKQTFVVLIANTSGVEQFKQTVYDADTFSNTFALTESGTYVLKVIAEYDAAQKTIVVVK